jgi:two-component system, chemotaxis family, protein-glutamate methylesterase/glutaminase
MKKIKVLIVDDSGYVITVVTKRLQDDSDIEVVGSARDGVEAIEKVKALQPDVVTMDVIMPKMDGLTALKHIMEECPTPVLMLSALTSENAESTIRALEHGAVDFYLKPSAIKPEGKGSGDDTLISKVKTAARHNLTGKKPPAPLPLTLKNKRTIENDLPFNKLVIIGSSTGGPRALMQVVPSLPEDISAAIILVQHMPPVFTRTLAERLHLASAIQVAEAREGDVVRKGLALMAPGGYHMIVSDDGHVHLNQEPAVLGVRPAIDVTMKSAAGVYRKDCLGVVLTGMGTDGTIGAACIKEAGGKVLAQDEATCAVYGMPASVFQSGCVDKVLPLPKIADEITRVCEN